MNNEPFQTKIKQKQQTRQPTAPRHIRIRSAGFVVPRRGLIQAELHLKLVNHAKKDEGKGDICVMYGGRVAGRARIGGLRGQAVQALQIQLDLPRRAYLREIIPLQVYLNDRRIDSLQLRRSPPPMVRLMHPDRHPPILRHPGGDPAINAWITPNGDTFFTDEEITLRWEAANADEVSLDWDFGSAKEDLQILADARRDPPIGHDDFTFAVGGYPLIDNEIISGRGVGFFKITARANRTTPEGAHVSDEQGVMVNVINRPNFRPSNTDHANEILAMVKRVEPLVHEGITLNDALDQVDVFARRVMDRYEFGLKVEEALEGLNRFTFVIETCTDEQMLSGECAGGDYNEAHPGEINFQFSENSGPTDYALLHELCHYAGFNSTLRSAYQDLTDDEFRNRVETMCAEVSAAPFS